jgi:hypothetical protein
MLPDPSPTPLPPIPARCRRARAIPTRAAGSGRCQRGPIDLARFRNPAAAAPAEQNPARRGAIGPATSLRAKDSPPLPAKEPRMPPAPRASRRVPRSRRPQASESDPDPRASRARSRSLRLRPKCRSRAGAARCRTTCRPRSTLPWAECPWRTSLPAVPRRIRVAGWKTSPVIAARWSNCTATTFSSPSAARTKASLRCGNSRSPPRSAT